ncbi:polysaccharide deacetylase family protein [Solihabitans fulvus]|uniref:Polysaccharide deacetylase family protein n=1 Tax=Solihabitans fulvus TaxID=1892852 RepID=A0A5B2X5X4_9PSEU|nr:polysaccharide deacetylase family protein [Solihabitans fulvus]KAA2258541.1 polysaccharide deacetylase family protein [Solihabitans fulvus]
MRRGSVLLALALAAGLTACTNEPVAMPPAAREPVPSSSTSSAAPSTSTPAPTTAKGPGGTTVPVFQQPYPFGTEQAKVPPIVDGKVPVIKHIETTKPYVFITIDDGVVRDPTALGLMTSAGVRPTLFLNGVYVKDHTDYFKPLQDQAGVSVENHTTSHPDLRGKPYEFQKHEICGNADFLQQNYGKRATLFRPPFGNYDENTRKAAADCGMKALVMWTAAVNDGVVQFQAGKQLKPGDIVLMHFRKTFVEDFEAFLHKARENGLTPVPLVDFLSV